MLIKHMNRAFKPRGIWGNYTGRKNLDNDPKVVFSDKKCKNNSENNCKT